ncbi:MAG: hypothetical protein GXP62_16725 [Oligoflexia bacterium]|nr:hypothetical protein [Oligoflexia bacterium]
MERLDPEGDATEHDPDLALNIHRWVARSWLALGEVKRARRVLNRVLSPAAEDPKIKAIDHRVRDAEETHSLGAAVRPPNMPFKQRWSVSVLPEADEEGNRRTRWFAGRVDLVDHEGVHVVFATTEEDGRARRLLRKVMSIDAWRAASKLPPRAAVGRFVEIGEYGDRLLIEPVTTYSGGGGGIHEDDLRYLERWAAE